MKKTFILTVFMMLCSLAFGEEVNVAKIGETEYATLSAAISAATEGQTITFIADITEDVTISKNNLTIDGAGKTYTGTMTANNFNVTVTYVKFYNGGFYKPDSGTSSVYTVKNCSFDGANKAYGYAISLSGAKTLIVEDCTVKDYSYGFLYVSSSLLNHSVKNVTVDNCNYGVRMVSTNTTNLENFVVTNTCWPVQIKANGARTVNMTNCSITETRDYNESYPGISLSSWGGTYNVTFNFTGTNEIDIIPTDSNLKYNLKDNSTLIAPVGMSFGKNVVYKEIIDNKYGYTHKGEETIVAQIGGTNYISLADAVATAPKKSTVEVLTNDLGEQTLTIVEEKNFTLNLKGAKITANFEIYGNLIVEGDENLNAGSIKLAKETATLKAKNGLDVTPLDGYEVVYTEGVYSLIKLVAKIDNVKYATLSSAIEAAQAGETITLLQSSEGHGIVINKSITIDFGGYTYSFVEQGVGDTPSKSNGFQIKKGDNNTVTLKNGTLNVKDGEGEHFYILVQNYANLNVVNMNLDGTNLDMYSLSDQDSYVLSNNSGTVNIEGLTTITANNDGEKAFAFDVCKYGNYEAPIVNVYGNEKGKPVVNGDIEVAESINENLHITAGTFTMNVQDWCDDKYFSIENEDGKWIVEGPYEAKIEDQYYTTFQAAYNAAQAGHTITLLADVKLISKCTIAKAITIDGNGHSIIADETAVWYTVSGKLQIKNYNTHLIGVNSGGVTLKDVVLDCNANAAGINIYCAQNVVFDSVSIINATKGFAALTVNGSTLTTKTSFTALGNAVAIDISNGSNVTSALGLTVEEGTVYDLGNKTVKFASVAANNVTGAVDAEGNPYFAAMDNAYYYTIAQINSRTNAYSNGLILLTDVTINKDIKFSGSTLNLNGCSLTLAENKYINVTGNVVITGEGNIYAQIKLTVGKQLTAPEGLTVIALDPKYMVVYDRDSGIYSTVVAVASVNGTLYASLEAAVEAAQAGETVTLLADVANTGRLTLKSGVTMTAVDDATISGNSSIVMQNGSVLDGVNFKDISNGSNLSAVYATAVAADDVFTVKNCTFNNVDWDCVQASTPKDFVGTVAYNITGNTFSGKYKRAIHVEGYGTEEELVKAVVTDNKIRGEYATSIAAFYLNLAEGSNFTRNFVDEQYNKVSIATGEYISGNTENILNETYLALPFVDEEGEEITFDAYVMKDKFNGEFYATLQAAVEAADGEDDVVVLVADAEGAGVVINKDVTIDFNGNTYSFNEGVGSTGTESNGFQILSGDVKLMNGTLNVAETDSREFYIIIQNYTNLTVENMVLDGEYLDKWAVVETDQDSYVLSNNSGEVHIVNTHIIANNDGNKAYAFDVDKTAVVYVEGEDTKIEGKVAVTGGQYNLNISAGTFTNEIMKDWCHEAYVPTQNESVWTVREGCFVAEVVDQVKARYETIDEAAARANSIEGTQTILVLADNVASAPVVVTDEIINLNGNTVKADIIGTIITNGGLWTTPQNYKMIGVDADYYATEAATIVMGANSIEMQEGEVTLVPSVWYTLDNQTLTIASGAKFNIGAGKTFVVRENTSVLNNGTVNNAGTVQILAGATVKGNLIGNIAFAGGSLVTADIDPTTDENFKMVGKVGDYEYYYNTNNAAINISANGSVAIMSGDMTLGKSWRTLPGQTVTVADNASFTVPAGMTYEIRGTVIAAEGARLTTNGEVILAATTATLTAAEDLKVKSGVENYVVKYADGVYSLSELQLATINSGWNWFSHYRGNDVLGQLQNQLIGNGGNQIKSHMDGFTFVNGGEWEGNLEATSPAKMYMIHNKEAADIEIQGDLADAATEITIHKGWNWIGYPVSESVNFEDALEDLVSKAQVGDRIKSRNNGYLEFISNGNFTGWDGGMESFVPGQGYMYYSKNETEYTFTYTVPASKAEARANVTADNNHWVPNSADYANNMTVTAVLNIDGNMMKEGFEVAAFANGEVRGSARPVFVEAIGQYVMFMTIYGEGSEELTFKCYDIYSDEEYTLGDRMVYADDAMIGSVGNPYMLTLNTIGIGENGYSTISLYPNPTTTNAAISFEATCDMVEVFNSLGVRVAEYRNVDTIDGMEAAGVYVIRVTNGETVQNCRLIVK